MSPTKTTAFSIDEQPEVFSPPRSAKDKVARALEAGRVRRLGERLYTTNLIDPPDVICRRNWARVAGVYFPGAVLTGRTAIEMRPASDGSVFLDAKSDRPVEVGGLRLRPRRGPGRLEGDQPFMGAGLFLSSRPRAFLDNMRRSRSRGGSVRRTLERDELERALDQSTQLDPRYLNQLRDEARALAPHLGAEKEAAELDELIGALQGTRGAELKSEEGRLRARGLSFDATRIEMFERLATELLRTVLPAHEDVSARGDTSTFAFFEAYFSNYIEGTEFTLEEAERIVFEGEVPAQRPEDAHDVLGTYLLAADPHQRVRVPATADELIDILRGQHAQMLRERPDIGPGQWKRANNRVGGWHFVDKNLTEGTLRRAFPIYETLPPGFARAAFAMFLVTEVHPFADGNGRMARLLMNSELSAAQQQRIIVTTRRRSDYISIMRGLSANFTFQAYITILSRVQSETAAIDFTDRDRAQSAYIAERAFDEPDTGGGGALLGAVLGNADDTARRTPE